MIVAVSPVNCGGCWGPIFWYTTDTGILDESGEGITDELGNIIESENGESMKQSEYDVLAGALPQGALLLAAIPDEESETGYTTYNITPTQWLDYVLGRYTIDIAISGAPEEGTTDIVSELIEGYEVANVSVGGQDYNAPNYTKETASDTLTMTNELKFFNGDIVTLKLSK